MSRNSNKFVFQPKGYKRLSKENKLRICNGTGASGTPVIITKLLDNIFGIGLNFAPASNIHDYCYFMWNTWIGKIFADALYLFNMITICLEAILDLPISNAIGSLILLPIRVLRAFLYFFAVLFFGWKAFYNGK